MKVYVTGIAGFIGSTVAGQLRDRGHDVSGCDDLSMGNVSNVPAGIRWQAQDVRAIEAIDADVVIHLAAMACARWPEDAEVWQRNLVATSHLTQIFKGRIVFSSTCVAADPLLGAYAGSKWACEQILPRATRFRFANVYGPKQRDWGVEPGVLAVWQKAERAGQPIRIDGDGSQTRDFIHVDDVARALCLAAESDAGTGTPWVSVRGFRHRSLIWPTVSIAAGCSPRATRSTRTQCRRTRNPPPTSLASVPTSNFEIHTPPHNRRS